MGKRIVFCADGTWDTADSQTNVYRLYKALLVRADQIPLYDDGVGSDGTPIAKLLGGAFGAGLLNKIKDGYRKIAHVYEAGDSVFLFGFSRGAYTARSLAGMVAAAGLPTQNFSDDLVEIAFDAYRQTDKTLRAQKLQQLANCNMDANPTIEMVGVWDTVGSLGIPSGIGGVDPIAYSFLNTGLNPRVRNGYHALAIDERRAQFPATLWDEPAGPNQTIEQVWFTGAHSDVGGGEPSDGLGTTALSDLTLSWMMSKASALGLEFDTSVATSLSCPLDAQYALDVFHESWKLLFGFPQRRVIDKSARIANSVAIRCTEDASWRPVNLSFENDALAASYTIVDVCKKPVAAAKAAGG